MNTINSILNESLILEAIRINSGKEALELVRNNKIGVKVSPTYRAALDQDDEKYKKYLERYFQEIIDTVGPNNAVFAIQLAVNKLPAKRLALILDDGYFYKIVSCKNKPWAKDNNEFKDLITFDSKHKKYVEEEWKRVSDWIREEEENHGKANKGSGDKEMSQTLYNDGTWSLQIPNSFQGAKAISFYGKKGEEPKPTHWCTRADKKYYDHYSSNSPLYVIRNWKTGDAYQLAFLRDRIEFLDKDDQKGDDITKGDLTKIPDGLLEKIKNKGKSLKDYKQEKAAVDKVEKNGPLSKGGKFKDPSDNIEEARWGKEVSVGNNIVKRVWENYSEIDNADKISGYMINNKKPSSYVKHAGSWGIKYYFEDNPDFFILISKSRGSKLRIEYFQDDHGNIEELTAEEFSANVDDFDLMREVAEKDSGYGTFRSRDYKKAYEFDKANDLRNLDNLLAKLESTLEKNINKTLNHYLDGVTCKVEAYNPHDPKNGGFIPSHLELTFYNEVAKEIAARFKLLKDSKLRYQYDDQSAYKEHKVFFNMLSDVLGKEKAIDMDRDIINVVNSTMKYYYREAIKNKDLSQRRVNARGNNRGLYYESYFPY